MSFFSFPSFGQGFSIKGKIVDLTTKEPIKDLAVRLYYEDYTNADTIKEKIWLDILGDRSKDTMYLKPKLKIIDSTWSDTGGNFYFSKLKSGLYTVHCRIRKVKRGYQVDSRDHVDVSKNFVFVELTPKIYCEYDKYKNQDFCPDCLKKDKVLKAQYGLPQFPLQNNVYYIGYCERDPYCYARWYCVKCNKLF